MKDRFLSEADFRWISSRIEPEVGRATWHCPGPFPAWLSRATFAARDELRNELSRVTISSEAGGNYIVTGVRYLDRKDGQLDEDHFVTDRHAPHRTIYYPGTSWEKANPLYKGTHRGREA